MGCNSSKGAETGAANSSAPQDKSKDQAPADSTKQNSGQEEQYTSIADEIVEQNTNSPSAEDEPAQQQEEAPPASDPVPE